MVKKICELLDYDNNKRIIKNVASQQTKSTTMTTMMDPSILQETMIARISKRYNKIIDHK